MAGERCGDCVWWDAKKTRKQQYGKRKRVAVCKFPVPFWAPRDYDGLQCDETVENEGSGCPQFKRRDEK